MTVRRRRRTRQVTVSAAVLATAGGVTWTGYAAGGDRPVSAMSALAAGGSP